MLKPMHIPRTLEVCFDALQKNSTNSFLKYEVETLFIWLKTLCTYNIAIVIPLKYAKQTIDCLI